MPIPRYLAMTPEELEGFSPLPPAMGWMACRFSPQGKGLCDLPRELPPGSLLIVNDSLPWAGHDPDLICGQLREVMENFCCAGVLLDFERPDNPEQQNLAKHLSNALPCPVAVSEPYAAGLTGPVFLSPVPPETPLSQWADRWQSREKWLELAPGNREITVTDQGALTEFSEELPSLPFREGRLHCHYGISVSEDRICFHLGRTPEDQQDLLAEAEALGFTAAVGLWQELGF